MERVYLKYKIKRCIKEDDNFEDKAQKDCKRNK